MDQRWRWLPNQRSFARPASIALADAFCVPFGDEVVDANAHVAWAAASDISSSAVRFTLSIVSHAE